MSGLLERGAESLDLRVNLVVGNDALPDFRHLPSQEVYGPNDNAWRRGNAPED
jgi:hypothetical protein